jgi:hypothetical protein
MKSSLLYRVASVLLVLFAIGHTLGFRRVDPKWGVDAAIGTLKATRFEVQAHDRTYWDFYAGFGLFVAVFLLFAAAMAWQLGSLHGDTLYAPRANRLDSRAVLRGRDVSELAVILHGADRVLRGDHRLPDRRRLARREAVSSAGRMRAATRQAMIRKGEVGR